MKSLLKVTIPLIGVLAACSEGSTGNLSLALTSRSPSGPTLASRFGPGLAFAPAVSTAGDSTTIVMGNDTIVLRSVELVLREIELKRVETTTDCDSTVSDDACEEFEVGPILVALPLGTTTTETVVTISAPAGLYDELEFDIHKPEDSDDAAFIAAHPPFDGIAIRVMGTYSQAGTRGDFVYTSDLNAEQEMFLSPPITVIDGSGTNVTLRLDVGVWFLNEAGTALVDPASANKGQVNENVVKDRIQASVDAFRDDDRDGHDDDHEGT
ncbi:MAG: hypothetical protein Q8Q14_09970 [Gemmatimonadales bacterium]|nr:hypothetical protein [Gemmatimonadales bacterium]